MKLLNATVLALSLLCPLLPVTAMAGFAEGDAAYKQKDYATALRELKPLAVQGHAGAQNDLGEMYAKGQGVPNDDKEAVRLYRLASDQGNSEAQYNLGWMYELGFGVDQDNNDAVKWYRLAADQGNADAQHNLGSTYFFGQGVPQDYKEAVRLFRLAADQGNASYQSNLGQRYVNGEGVPRDYKEALKWFRLAASQGDAGAEAVIRDLEEKISLASSSIQDGKSASNDHDASTDNKTSGGESVFRIFGSSSISL